MYYDTGSATALESALISLTAHSLQSDARWWWAS